MSRTATLSGAMMLGFDQIERLADRVGKSVSDGYPPYNIERTSAHGRTILRITLAVAGFSPDELDIVVEDRQLQIRGRQNADDGNREFLHRGIAARQFHRAFVLADGMEVSEADLKDGLLKIELVRLQPEQSVKRIKIATQSAEKRSGQGKAQRLSGRRAR